MPMHHRMLLLFLLFYCLLMAQTTSQAQTQPAIETSIPEDPNPTPKAPYNLYLPLVNNSNSTDISGIRVGDTLLEVVIMTPTAVIPTDQISRSTMPVQHAPSYQ